MKAQFIQKRQLSKIIWQFDFKLSEDLYPQPGAFIKLQLPNMKSEKENNYRFFSIADLKNNYLSIITNLGPSEYKQTLGALTVQQEIEIAGPFGTFLLPQSSSPMVMIAGGIGITPFLSMLKSIFITQANKKLTLLYSNKTPRDAIFIDQLNTWRNQNHNFNLKLFFTKEDQLLSTTDCFGRRINVTDIKMLTTAESQCSFWICGSPLMVDDMITLLKDEGLNNDRIHFEKFKGYQEIE